MSRKPNIRHSLEDVTSFAEKHLRADLPIAQEVYRNLGRDPKEAYAVVHPSDIQRHFGCSPLTARRYATLLVDHYPNDYEFVDAKACWVRCKRDRTT